MRPGWVLETAAAPGSACWRRRRRQGGVGGDGGARVGLDATVAPVWDRRQRRRGGIGGVAGLGANAGDDGGTGVGAGDDGVPGLGAVVDGGGGIGSEARTSPVCVLEATLPAGLEATDGGSVWGRCQGRRRRRGGGGGCVWYRASIGGTPRGRGSGVTAGVYPDDQRQNGKRGVG